MVQLSLFPDLSKSITPEDAHTVVSRFFSSLKAVKVGEGSVALRHTPEGYQLAFTPMLEEYLSLSFGCNSPSGVLYSYLSHYVGSDRQGVIWAPPRYVLHKTNNYLTLSLESAKRWEAGIVIDVISRELPGATEAMDLLQQGKVSSFVYGRVRERKDIGRYTVLERFFLE